MATHVPTGLNLGTVIPSVRPSNAVPVYSLGIVRAIAERRVAVNEAATRNRMAAQME